MRQVLAEVMLSLRTRAEREVVCLLTDMEQPLGAAVGNALEVREALETVRGNGPEDFTELCARRQRSASRALRSRDRRRRGRRRAEASVADGSAERDVVALDRAPRVAAPMRTHFHGGARSSAQ